MQVVDRESLLGLFTDQRERVLLHDANILSVLDGVIRACKSDEALLGKLHRRNSAGLIPPKKRRRTAPSPPGGAEAPAGGAAEVVELDD